MRQIILTIISLIVLSACGQSNENNQGNEERPELLPIEVDLQVPQSLEVDQHATFTAVVTQGEAYVNDAKEVQFEIWEDGQKDTSEMIDAQFQEDGEYTIEKAFTADGIYHVQSHVTARDMHTMPKVEVIVGNPERQDEDKDEEQSSTESDEHDTDSSQGHGDVIASYLSASNLEAHMDERLQVEVINANQPLEKAYVSLEIAGPEADINWIDLTESEKGIYASDYTFVNVGTYSVTIHVKKDDIHEHQEIDINVQ